VTEVPRDRSIEHHLATQKIYDLFHERLAIWGTVYGFTTQTSLDAALDRVLAMGKVIGRRSALLSPIRDAEEDALVRQWLETAQPETEKET